MTTLCSPSAGRIDWKDIRDRVDLARVATALLGPTPGRRGERGRKLWWPCPLHDDKNPSFAIDPAKPWWKCYGCGEHGDAANLVMRINKVAFPEAVRVVADLSGIVVPSVGSPRPPASPTTGKPAEAPGPPPERSSGLPLPDALALVTEATERLWKPEGAEALAYLHGRGLHPDTIRAARLGWTPGVMLSGQGGDRRYRASGVIVPWFEGDRLALVKIRRGEGLKPKYIDVYRERPAIFPSPAAVRHGRPLIITEGEFDCLLLAQELGELAAVVTLGSASNRPDTAMLWVMLAARVWFIATDADDAGDRSASEWPARARQRQAP